MKVYTESHGSGPDIVLVHGWGLHGGIWKSVAKKLADSYRVTIVDLPGYGRSPLPNGDYTLETVAELVAEVAPNEAAWIGWSLGGMVAMQLALAHAAHVQRLILIASTPKFIAGDDWPWGLDANVFHMFEQNLVQDARATLSRFFALQVHDLDNAQETLRKLRHQLTERAPEQQALELSLAILRRSDLRSALARIQCPTLLIQGNADNIVTQGTATALQQALPNATLQIIRNAGHAPFLSHEKEFLNAVDDFLL